jgi:hypothetical protein
MPDKFTRVARDTSSPRGALHMYTLVYNQLLKLSSFTSRIKKDD